MSDIKVLRKSDESPKQYRIRLYKNKDLYGLNNSEIGKLCNEAFGVNYDESTHRKKVKYYLQGYYDAKEECSSSDDGVSSLLEELKQTKLELQKERYKLQSEKIDYNRAIREESRDELIAEKIVNAIHELDPGVIINDNLFPITNNDEKEFVLIISDMHYGCEFEIKGLHNEVINKYSPEVFRDRMNLLLLKVLDIVEKESVNTLHIYNLGDDIDGCLRVSQLWKLRYGVVDATIKYAMFISEWLNELSKFVNIKYQMVVDGNHSQLRMLGQPKNTFKDDNMSKVIALFIKERLKNNSNFIFIENQTGMVYDTLCGYNILGIHGEVKSMEKTIKNFSDIYNTKINYLFAGHLHHNESKEISKHCEVINIGSIIGIDDYSLSLQKYSIPSAKMICFDENGKSIEYTIILENKNYGETVPML